jgi:hypothetical protein
MFATSFDILGYFEKLNAAGIPEPQAKTHTDAIRGLIEDGLTTKRDLHEMEIRLDLRLALSRFFHGKTKGGAKGPPVLCAVTGFSRSCSGSTRQL